MVLQVGTTSFQSTAGESSRRPVDTFVRPVSVLPKTGMMELAETLSTINPTLQKIVNFKINEAKQEGILEGQNQILGSTPTEINKIKKELEKKEGKRFARNFIGGNIYMQYGIEKQLAINLGNAAEAKTKKFFDEYIVNLETDNGTIQQPLSQFDINSEAFKTAINDFQQTSLKNAKGIRPELVNQYLLPKQNLALQKVFNKQIENLADAKIEQANTLFSKSILNSWFSIDNFNDSIENGLIEDNKNTEDLSTAEFLALQDLQTQVDDLAARGLTTTVAPANIFETVKNNAYEILDYYEKNNLDLLVAEEEIESLIDWVGNLKVGPSTILKDGTKIQSKFSDFYIKDGKNQIMELLTDVDDKIQESLKKEDAVNKLRAEKQITRDFENINFNIDLTETDENGVPKNLPAFKSEINKLTKIRNANPNSTKYFLTKYENLNTNVDLFFTNMRLAIDKGEYSGNINRASEELETFMSVVLPIASKEDLDNYEKLQSYIKTSGAKSITTKNPEMTRLIKRAEEILSGGERNSFSGDYDVTGNNSSMLFDLNEEFYKLAGQHQDINKIVDIDGNQISVKSWYKSEINKIKNTRFILDKNGQIKGVLKNKENQTGTYEFHDSFNNLIDKSTLEREGQARDNLKKSIDLNKKLQSSINNNQKIVSDMNTTPSLGVTDGSLLAMNLPEKKEKIITAKDLNIKNGIDEPNGVKRQEHNFPIFYKLAKEAGHKFPELTAAQAMEETGNGKSPSGKNNYLGLKANKFQIKRGQSSLLDTEEDFGRGNEPVKDRFTDYVDIRDQFIQYKTEWNDPFKDRKGIVSVDTPEEALDLILSDPTDMYATGKGYKERVLQIIKDAKKDPPLF